jgi:hypothetical protein
MKLMTPNSPYYHHLKYFLFLLKHPVLSNDHIYSFCEWLSIHFTGEKRDVVKIRGPKEDVDKCHKHLLKIVKELNESSYVIEVPIYKQFHKFVIGKGGANIRKVRI